VALWCAPGAHAAEGDLDPGFGSGGTLIAPIGSSSDEAHAVAIDSQGRIVAAGQSSNGSALNDFSLARFEPNGGLDPGFGTGGKVLTTFGPTTDDLGRAIGIDSLGRIVVAGSSNSGSNNDFAVVRYDPGGTVDGSFHGIGTATTPIGAGDDSARGLAIDSQNRIVVAGSSDNGSNNDFAVVRYDANGNLDASFNGTGKVTTPIGGDSDVATAVAIDSQGRIVVVGRTFNGTKDDFAVARYTASGALDTTFNGTGKVTTSFSAGGFDEANAVTIDSQGRIVVAGQSFNGTNDDFAVARYTPSGALDSTFNGTGKVTTPIVNGDDDAEGVAIDPQGRIVAAGFVFGTSADFGLARYNPDGSLDTTFNGTGKVTTSLTAGNDRGRAVAIDAQERIVVAGDTGNDFALARYIGDQTPPTVTISGGPPDGGFTNDSAPAFDFTSSESGSSFACGFDSVAPSGCSSPFTVGTALVDGRHSVSITGTDRAGNTSAPATRAFTVDTRNPKLTIKGKKRVRAKGRRARARFKLKADEPVALACKVDRKKPKRCGSKFRTPRLRRGAHKLKVTATDRAGNKTSKTKRLRVVEG